MFELQLVDALTLVFSALALLISLRASRKADELDNKKEAIEETTVQHYLDQILQVVLEFKVREPSTLTQQDIQSDITSYKEVIKRIREKESQIISVYPELADSLNAITFRLNGISSISDFNVDNVVDEMWLVRAWRDLYGDFLNLAVKRKRYSWLHRHYKQNREVTEMADIYLEPLAKRNWAFGAYGLAHGYEASALEAAGKRSKFVDFERNRWA
ncbi:MAG: hypothetical protein N0E54_03005 [Candidatus Thiodiazotropha taylori]|nr:hypothetical protein [Candidatus Thiodiazotropha endolucinida]MCW4227695.1 hypothetical protein [Candidatus Thiodiazotropha taylori]